MECGGGMALLAEQLGYVQLPIPVRFSAEWEQDASLRLRVGDASILPTTTNTAGSAATMPSSWWTRRPASTSATT